MKSEIGKRPKISLAIELLVRNSVLACCFGLFDDHWTIRIKHLQVPRSVCLLDGSSRSADHDASDVSAEGLESSENIALAVPIG